MFFCQFNIKIEVMELIFKIAKQAWWQVLARVSTILVGILLLSLISRNFGEEGTGVYTLALTYLSFFYLAVDLGLNGYILERVQKNKQEANKLFNFRFYWSFLLVFLAVFTLPYWPFYTKAFGDTVLFGAITIITFGISNSANLVLQNSHTYFKQTISAASGSLVAVFTGIYLIYAGLPVEFFALTQVGMGVSASLIILTLIKQEINFKLSFPDFAYPIQILKTAWPICATLIINTVYFRADSFILSTFRPLIEVGNYNLAYTIFQDTLILPTFIMNSYYPIMLKNLRENREIFFTQLKYGALLMAGFGLIGLIAGLILSPFVVWALSGGGFFGASESLRILSISYPAFFLSSLFIWTFMAFGEYKKMLLIYGTGFLFNLTLNLVFIPRYSFFAASWITVASEYLILVLQTIILYRIIKKR